MQERRALVAMSGGVDSSVAVYLMKEKGYAPVGVTMMLHEEDAACVYGTHSCCTPDDIEDEILINFLVFFIFKNIGILPIRIMMMLKPCSPFLPKALQRCRSQFIPEDSIQRVIQ